MIDRINDNELIELIGWGAFDDWTELRCAIEDRYNAAVVWSACADCGKIECKYVIDGKTLCTLCAVDKKIGLTVDFDNTECKKAASLTGEMSAQTADAYAAAIDVGDGKRATFPIVETLIDELIKLLEIKRKFDK